MIKCLVIRIFQACEYNDIFIRNGKFYYIDDMVHLCNKLGYIKHTRVISLDVSIYNHKHQASTR